MIGGDARMEVSISQALRSADAAQLRRALRVKLIAAMPAVDDSGDYIDPDLGAIEDRDALDEAVARWRRGEKREALHHLENALGRDFAGLGDLKPEDLS